MYQTIASFVEEWKKEAELTLRVLDKLTDASLEQKVWEQGRTAEQLAWHLVESIHYMTAMGLELEAPQKGTAPSASSIAAAYHKISNELVTAVQGQWTEQDLLKQVEIGGEAYTYGASLQFTLMHQAHHRGQLTVLMRQGGLRAPDVYGPTKEDWLDQGMEPYV